MKVETKEKVFELFEKKFIDIENYKKFSLTPNDKTLKSVISSQFIYSIHDLDKIKINLFESWKTINTIFNENEILLINHLLNCLGLLSRKDLMKKTKMDRRKLSIAVEGLISENAIDTVCLSQNNTLIFIKREYFDKILNKKNDNKN